MENGTVVQFLPGRTKGSVILHIGDGFYYLVKEVRGERARLHCRRYKGTKCSATGSLDLNTGLVYPLKPHTCPRDELFVVDVGVRAGMIRAAGQNVLGCSVRKILRDIKLGLNPELAQRFTTARMHTAMYCARAANYPKIPSTLIYLGVLLGLPNLKAVCQTSDGQDFIFRGVVGNLADKTVSVIFASGRMIQFLNNRSNLHMDGTFRKRPRKPKCQQIYNIVTNYQSCIVCIVRVLMMSRSENAYITLFDYLKTLAPNLSPARIHCDFERAVINALRLSFPNSDIVGCLWHYGACIGRKCQKLGLAPLASTNIVVHTFIRCVGGAALLPAPLIGKGIDEIWLEVQASGWQEKLRPLFEYFEKEWLPRAQELSTFGQLERTNNVSESDNRMIANVAPQNHPNIWKLIGGFVQLEHLAYSDKLAAGEGRAVTEGPKWKTLANDMMIRRLSRLLIANDITPGHFLKSASSVVEGAIHHGMRIDYGSDSDESDDGSEGSDDDDGGEESQGSEIDEV